MRRTGSVPLGKPPAKAPGAFSAAVFDMDGTSTFEGDNIDAVFGIKRQVIYSDSVLLQVDLDTRSGQENHLCVSYYDIARRRHILYEGPFPITRAAVMECFARLVSEQLIGESK